MSGKKRGPNWTAIKAEYLAGGTSYRKLAAKHQVNASTLEKRAKREKWADQLRRVSGEIAAEMPAAIAREVVTEAAKYAAKHTAGFDEVWGMVLAEVRKLATTEVIVPQAEGKDDDPPEPYQLTPLEKMLGYRRAASAMRDVQTGIRKALGLDEMKGGDDPTDPLDRLERAISRSVELHQAADDEDPDEP